MRTFRVMENPGAPGLALFETWGFPRPGMKLVLPPIFANVWVVRFFSGLESFGRFGVLIEIQKNPQVSKTARPGAPGTLLLIAPAG